jgi:hypothetical protein
MPPPVSSAVILTKAVGGNEVSHGAKTDLNVSSRCAVILLKTVVNIKESHCGKLIALVTYERTGCDHVLG